jgi:predicted metal-dependent peptidase
VIRGERAQDKEGLELITYAVQDIILWFPLCGFSLLGEAIEIEEDLSIHTLCTDGRKIYYSPDWMRTLQDRGAHWMSFDVLHEWLHVFFNHVARLGDRDRNLWNIACDYVVVNECIQIFKQARGKVLSPPADGVQPPQWSKGLSAEKIYDQLFKEAEKNPQPQVGGGAPDSGDSSGQNEILSSTDFMYDQAQNYTKEEEEGFRKTFVEELQQAHAVQTQMKGARKMYGTGLMQSRMQQLKNPTVPWRALLRGTLSAQLGCDHTNWARPRRTLYPMIILPTMRAYKERKLFVGIDVSGSVGNALLREFLSNVIPAAMRAERTIVASFDAVVRECVVTRKPRKIFNQVQILQGSHGYTSVVDLFKYVDQHDPTAVVVFTDAYIELPDKPYPKTIWVVPERAPELPWGKMFRMSTSW